MKKNKIKKIRFDISVWVAVSAIAVLVVILGMMIFMQFEQRNNQAQTIFVEKGTTLIQSFEAGMRGRTDDVFYLQKLLMETAQQPDIDYMIVTDAKGEIVADSDPSTLGRFYGLDLDIRKVAVSKDIRWRQTANPEGAGTFEVYRGFFPERFGGPQRDHPPLVVFVGFNMDKIEKESRQHTLRMLILALVFVLIGSLAIVSLFLAQAYRLTRASLSRMTVFSDALVKNMPIALLATDKTGKIIACNEQAGGLFSLSCAGALGQEAGRLLPREFSTLLDSADLQTGLVEKDIAVASEADGVRMWEVVVTAFADEDVHEGKILLARNVTAIRQMEREVARSRHLNAIGSLAAGVAHEIRNPLSSIKGFAVYFRQRLAGNPDDVETADIMIAETERLNRVISQLIEFARPLELKREPTDVADLVRQTLRLIATEAKDKSVEVDVQAQEDLPQVPVDPDKIKQVFLNIFLNALAALPQGGRLSVALTLQNHGLAATVSDTGEGISEENLPRIYDPYFTSKPAGTGLGLAIVQKIMEAHGGTVRVESRAQKGTTVTLRFGLTDDERNVT